MTSTMVWILVTVSFGYGYRVSYSPPLSDLASCERLQSAIPRQEYVAPRSRCVQVAIPVTK